MAENKNKLEEHLRLKMLQYQDAYFKDMTFRLREMQKGILSYEYYDPNKRKIMKNHRDMPFALSLSDWKVSFKELTDKTLGLYCPEKKTIFINTKLKGNQKRTIVALLHETIHAHEATLSKWYRDYLIIFLYKKILKKVSRQKFNEIMEIIQDIEFQKIEHSLLFLIKSLLLDVARNQKLCTTYGWGLCKKLRVGKIMTRKWKNWSEIHE